MDWLIFVGVLALCGCCRPGSSRACAPRGAVPHPRRSAGTDNCAERQAGRHRDRTDRQGVDLCDSFQKPKPGSSSSSRQGVGRARNARPVHRAEVRHRRARPARVRAVRGDARSPEDVASLSDQITLTVHDVRTESDLARDTGVSRVPTLVLRGAARGVVHTGIPAGLEFGTCWRILRQCRAVRRR